MVGAKREKSGAIVILTDEPKYSEALKTMRSVTMLMDVGLDVRSIRSIRIRTGEMILEIKRDKIRKNIASQKVLDEGTEVRTLTAESCALNIINLHEVMDQEMLATALRQYCEGKLATTAVRLRKGPAGTQVSLGQLHGADVNQFIKLGKLKVGWSECSLGKTKLASGPGHKKALKVMWK